MSAHEKAIEAAAKALCDDSAKTFSTSWDRLSEGIAKKLWRLRASKVIAAYQSALTVTTVEELDALPDDSVILARGTAYQRCGNDWDGDSRMWDRGQIVLSLPATVLHIGATP